jgi:hypothetical protein
MREIPKSRLSYGVNKPIIPVMGSPKQAAMHNQAAFKRQPQSGEADMIHAPEVRMQLHKGGHFTLNGARGARLTCIDGAAWITVDRDARDVVILPGESFFVLSDRSVLVGPLFGAVTLDLQGIRPAMTGATPRRRGPIAKMKALVGMACRLAQVPGQPIVY